MSKDAMKKYESGICAYCGKKKEEHNIEGIFIWCDESPEDIPTFADSGIAGVERNAFELLQAAENLYLYFYVNGTKDKKALELIEELGRAIVKSKGIKTPTP